MSFCARRAVLVIACALAYAAIAAAADLREDTGRAFDSYAEQATRAFVERIRNAKSAGEGSAARAAAPPRTGEIVARPGRDDGITSVPGGLVHHWVGSTFISGVTLKDALDVSSRYEAYPSVYKPIVASTLLSHDENTYRVLMRIKESAGGFSAVLDVTSRVQYFQPDNRSIYSISNSEQIQELSDAGTAKERKLSPGHDSGYLWRATAFTHMVERDGGVFVEMETIGLSRRFPTLLSWIIEPIARRVGRSSVERSLQEFSAAVRTRAHE